MDTTRLDARIAEIKPLLDALVPLVARALADDMHPTLVAETIGQQMSEHLHTQEYPSDCDRLSAACSVYGHAVVRMATAEQETNR